jgi:hypothetical protein
LDITACYSRSSVCYLGLMVGDFLRFALVCTRATSSISLDVSNESGHVFRHPTHTRPPGRLCSSQTEPHMSSHRGLPRRKSRSIAFCRFIGEAELRDRITRKLPPSTTCPFFSTIDLARPSHNMFLCCCTCRCRRNGRHRSGRHLPLASPFGPRRCFRCVQSAGGLTQSGLEPPFQNLVASCMSGERDNHGTANSHSCACVCVCLCVCLCVCFQLLRLGCVGRFAGSPVCKSGLSVCYFRDAFCYFGVLVCHLGKSVCELCLFVCVLGNSVCALGLMVCDSGNSVC